MAVKIPEEISKDILEEIWENENWEQEITDEEYLERKAAEYWMEVEEYKEYINVLRKIDRDVGETTGYSENGYNEYYEIDDERTMLLLTENAYKDTNEDEFIILYGEIANAMIKQLEQKYHTSIYAYGRSGRHVCMPITFDNWLNYNNIIIDYSEIKKKMHDGINKHGIKKFHDMI